MSERRTGRPVFDASAVLALLQGEAGSEKLLELQPEAVICTVNAAEALAKLIDRGMPARQAEAALGALHLEIVPFEPPMVAISTRFVSRGVSLGDRCFLAVAHQYGAGWTSDRELAVLPRATAPPLHFFR